MNKIGTKQVQNRYKIGTKKVQNKYKIGTKYDNWQSMYVPKVSTIMYKVRIVKRNPWLIKPLPFFAKLTKTNYYVPTLQVKLS